MYRSARLTALVPLGVVTVTSRMPEPAGATAVIWVGLSTLKALAAVLPNSTSVAPEKSVPVIVTVVPPASGPNVGPMPVTPGAGI